MNALLSVAKFPVPHAAVEEQREALVHDAIENMKAQGINLPNDSIPANAMLDQAEQRVRLGLQITWKCCKYPFDYRQHGCGRGLTSPPLLGFESGRIEW